MNEIYKAFGLLLRDLRNGIGMTQGQLADRVGMKRTTVTNIEQGTQSVSLQQMYELANGLGVKPAELLPAVDDESAHEVMRSLVTAGNVKLVQRMMGRNQNASRRGESPGSARSSGRKNSSN